MIRWSRHPKIQFLTVGELLDGKAVDYQRSAQVNITFKKASKAQGKQREDELRFP